MAGVTKIDQWSTTLQCHTNLNQAIQINKNIKWEKCNDRQVKYPHHKFIKTLVNIKVSKSRKVCTGNSKQIKCHKNLSKPSVTTDHTPVCWCQP